MGSKARDEPRLSNFFRPPPSARIAAASYPPQKTAPNITPKNHQPGTHPTGRLSSIWVSVLTMEWGGIGGRQRRCNPPEPSRLCSLQTGGSDGARSRPLLRFC